MRQHKLKQALFYVLFSAAALRACSVSFCARPFVNLLPLTALKSLAIRQVLLRLFALSSTKSCQKSAHQKILNRLLYCKSIFKKIKAAESVFVLFTAIMQNNDRYRRAGVCHFRLPPPCEIQRNLQGGRVSRPANTQQISKIK